MLEHESGMIGLPLRLLAREVYDRVTKRLGEDRVALITGEEKRVPQRPDYWICTTEAMPLTRRGRFVAINEVQLATHRRARTRVHGSAVACPRPAETWFMGPAAMRELLQRLVPAAARRTASAPVELSLRARVSCRGYRRAARSWHFRCPELYRWRTVRSAWRRGGGTRCVVAARPQRTGRDVSSRRGRLLWSRPTPSAWA